MFKRSLTHLFFTNKLCVSYCNLSYFDKVPFPKKIHWFQVNRNFFNNSLLQEKKSENISKELVRSDFFNNVSQKDKETYLDFIHIYELNNPQRRGHVEFIYIAMKHMKDFGVEKDLETYKSLINVLPKGKFIPTNIFQAEFMHYPKQQQCIIDLLEQMEEYGVVPDEDLEVILLNIFGNRGHPLRRYWRMMYWMPKFKNTSPWPLPNPVPGDALELAKLAIARITSVDLQSVVSVYKTADLLDSVEDTWIVSGQSPQQKELLENHPQDKEIYIKGAYKVWLRGMAVNYFVLMSHPVPRETVIEDEDDVSNLWVPLFDETDAKSVVPVPSVHEQDEGTIFSVCASGTSSKDSLLSWIRHLELDGNPTLAKVSIVITLKSTPGVELPAIEEGASSDLKKTD